MEAETLQVNTGRFVKGFSPWNKGISHLKGEKHPMFGKHHSPESIAKMKESLKGRPASNKGRAMSEEQKLKISLSKKGKHGSLSTEFKKGHDAKSFNWGERTPWNKGKTGVGTGFPKGIHNTKISGSNHYAWKGGITEGNHKIRTSLEFKIACSDSKERDDYTCQMPGCALRGGKLNSHHIKTFSKNPESRFEISNLITLCENCHRITFHKEIQYEKLFTEIINLKQKNG